SNGKAPAKPRRGLLRRLVRLLPALLVASLVVWVGLFVAYAPELPDTDALFNDARQARVTLIAADGTVLAERGASGTAFVQLGEVSPALRDAVIATEDRRFYSHFGVDLRGTARALLSNLSAGDVVAGGSTLTQQLAKNLFLPRDLSHDPAIVRASKLAVAKFKEWQTAVKLEKSYTKEEIITMYLNVFDFIYNAVGINSAARIYFNTTPDSLNIEQSAMLVGMLKNSVAYNPLRNEESALRRRNVVISQMERYGYISHAVADSVSQLPLGIDLREDSHNTGLATYLREYIRSTMNSREPERKSFWSEDQYNDALWRWE
ncbi:MAG: transglycosylase domain-containing protein, partial [Bacteroidales bacterium]|nr:transglycosylase domain-containing protein [Bacteroidales bacterium]